MIRYDGSIGENEVILRNMEYLESKNHTYVSEILPKTIRRTLSGIDTINMTEKLLPEIQDERVRNDLTKILNLEKKGLVEHIILVLNYEYFNNGVNISNADLIDSF
ncbi:hypothetical protein [Methanococcus maripaludis]|uniref:Uncharacterized protein n=2 Tax=Methanococcus maripaludis TaxID=39152 RepID=A0A7J9PHD9_METMI|nr:hypothetical protein [Methanococcus maripaludis]MBA2862652.1 hypothetical protein [Methanococcus maripaludis]